MKYIFGLVSGATVKLSSLSWFQRCRQN